MRRLFLLRAYGDFIIAIRAILNSPQPADTKVIASNHFKPLFEAIQSVLDLSSLDIDFQDFGINQSLLNLFTYKQIFRLQTIRQISKIRKYLKLNNQNNEIDYVEQLNRLSILNLVTGHKFKSIVNNGNVYKSYDTFFNNYFETIKTEQQNINSVLIVPDARTNIKTVPENVVDEIVKECKSKDIKVRVAKFNKNETEDDSNITYKNFAELIKIINAHDFIIGADSLPIHLSNFLKKPHCILYYHNIPNAFCTLFSLENKYFVNFNNFKKESIPFLKK